MTQNGEIMNSVNEQQITENARRDGKSERGASMVEYGILVALIAVIAIAGTTILGQRVSQSMSGIANQMPTN
jgi:pilus assembly protein Flp/PilA